MCKVYLLTLYQVYFRANVMYPNKNEAIKSNGRGGEMSDERKSAWKIPKVELEPKSFA